jgi:Ammonia permease
MDENNLDNNSQQNNNTNDNLQNQQYEFNDTPYQQVSNDQPDNGNAANQTPRFEQPTYSGESQYQQNSNQQYQYNPNYSDYNNSKPFDTFGLASLICGIVSTLFCCLFFITWAVAIAGIVLGILSLKNNKNASKVMAIFGIVFSSIGLVGALIVGVIALFANTVSNVDYHNIY